MPGGVTVNVSLLLRDGALEHLSIAAPAAPAAPATPASASAASASGDAKHCHGGALSPTTAAAAHGRISWVRLLQELVTATHAFSVEDDGPVMIDAAGAGTSPTSKSLVPSPDANASTRAVADCFHIAFTDDENDLVTVTSDSGLAEAYRVIEKSGKPALELSVTVLHPPPALSAFTAAGGNATANALDFKTIRTPQLAAAVAAAAAATSAYGAPGGAPASAAAAGALQRPGSGLGAAAVGGGGAAPNGGAVPHAQLPPGALPDSKLNPILGAITATVGGRPSPAAEAAGHAAAAAALQQLNGDDTSPFKDVVMKHTRRALQAFESFFLNLKKDHYVARTRRNQTFARVDEARTPAPAYALLKAKHQAELTAMDARLQRNIDLLVTEFDRYLSNQSPASFLLPLLVSITVENRGMRFEVPVRPCDTVADLRDSLMDLSARKMPGAGSAPPDPIVDFGPCSYFTLRRIGASDGKSQFVSSGGFASPSVSPPPGAGKSAEINPANFLDFLFGATPRKASSGKGGHESPPGSGNGKPLVIAPDREAHTSMAELGVTHGAEFVLIGGVRRKSEPPKCVVGQRNANASASAHADPSVPHHFACAECKETALCRGCAMTCHFGHTITVAPAADHPKPGQLQCGCGVVSAPVPAAPAAGAAAPAAPAAAAAAAGGVGGVLAASACRIRERASAVPPSQQAYTEELQLLRAMGYTDDMVSHMTMLVPAAALSPAPNPSPTPTPAPAAAAAVGAAAAPSPSQTPSPLPSQPQQQQPVAPPATVVVVVDAKVAAPAAAAASAAGAPAGAAAGAAAALAPAAAAGAPAAASQALVSVGVTLRGLLQSKSGNVQSVVDTLLAWERQGKLVAAPNASAGSAPMSGYKPAQSRPSPVAPVRRS